MPLPMLRLAPVTTATFPVRSTFGETESAETSAPVASIGMGLLRRAGGCKSRISAHQSEQGERDADIDDERHSWLRDHPGARRSLRADGAQPQRRLADRRELQVTSRR